LLKALRGRVRTGRPACYHDTRKDLTIMDANRAVLVRITGIVQGVGYRAWTHRRASGLGLSGFVRNCANGDVEALFSGAEGAVTAMLAACRRGPPRAIVTKVEIVGPAEPAAGAFTIAANR
jgi:acylphosphatase